MSIVGSIPTPGSKNTIMELFYGILGFLFSVMGILFLVENATKLKEFYHKSTRNLYIMWRWFTSPHFRQVAKTTHDRWERMGWN